jgi:hypothetical protein
MAENITGIPVNNYAADSVYRVNPMDRDTRGSSGERFDRQSGKKKKQPDEDNSENGVVDAAVLSMDKVLEPVVIRDDMMIVSENIEKDPVPKDVPVPESNPQPVQETSQVDESIIGAHINLTA